MEWVVILAIAVLAFVFFSGFIILIVFAVKKWGCKKSDLISEQHSKDTRSDAHLIVEGPGRNGIHEMGMGVELDDVEILNPRLEELLNNEQWVDEASELVPHCLFILNTCRDLAVNSVNLVNEAMEKGRSRPTQNTLKQIELATKRINPQVDAVVDSINPPLDPKLLEARFTALVLSVSQLVMITKYACRLSGSLDWIDKQLEEVEDHLQVLRQASTNQDSLGSLAEHQRVHGAVAGIPEINHM
ncbi:transmembrane protein 98-like [Plakobranchus ocellatus]|uniref:Transmembrane protein 98 n=1 Tax=Plakobranchus ocellatus TaxID=259542 RepID=A0AAV3YC38_9GAST|nr:transmembrane protein 98-like [Plakobranchus ocellatus]